MTSVKAEQCNTTVYAYVYVVVYVYATVYVYPTSGRVTAGSL